MRLTLEKVLVLKNVPLFAGIQENVLSDIIANAEETSGHDGRRHRQRRRYVE